MKGSTKKRRWPRLSKRQKDEAITRFADANNSDPFAARRAASRIKHGLFNLDAGVVHVLP
jgi:hypothetical protein